MDLNKLREIVDKLILAKNFGVSESFITEQIVRFLYDSKGRDLLTYFVLIDKLDKEKLEKEISIYYHGLEDALHNVSSYSRRLYEEKQPLKSIKELDNYLFGNEDGNIAHIIRTVIAYFPDGEVHGASNNGLYFFNKFVESLLKNKDKYLNGDSTEWAKEYGYYDYIKMIVEKHSNGEQEQEKES